ncbi:MAG: GIY-YIG nuclease family protein [Xanthobacteraceae bacterium]
MRRKTKSQTRHSLIQAFGLFWRADEINWSPGTGKRYDWRLYGRRGATSKKLQIADFRNQKGIYILYGNYGPHYVGLTRKKGLGQRLKDHLFDVHKGKWDRFSWFGFCTVLQKTDRWGIHKLRDMPLSKSTSPERMIADLEAMLIRSMALRNINRMKFVTAREWKQIEKDEWPKYERRL